jgi:hypothetical protein
MVCPSAWRIRSSDVAHPGRSDPMVCPPSPRGSKATPRDHGNILRKPAAAFKGRIFEKCVYSGTKQYYTRPIIFWPYICSSLKKKAEFKYLRRFELILETALGYQSGGRGRVLMKKPEAIIFVSVSLKLKNLRLAWKRVHWPPLVDLLDNGCFNKRSHFFIDYHSKFVLLTALGTPCFFLYTKAHAFKRRELATGGKGSSALSACF